jgi:hypothetical protein
MVGGNDVVVLVDVVGSTVEGAEVVDDVEVLDGSAAGATVLTVVADDAPSDWSLAHDAASAPTPMTAVTYSHRWRLLTSRRNRSLGGRAREQGHPGRGRWVMTPARRRQTGEL